MIRRQARFVLRGGTKESIRRVLRPAAWVGVLPRLIPLSCGMVGPGAQRFAFLVERKAFCIGGAKAVVIPTLCCSQT